MQLKEKKLFLEGYGILRMALGVFQLVGLLFGYFFYEWIVKYSCSVVPVVFQSDIIVLIYLAVLVRSIFHIIVGAGIARIENWSRYWFIFGWPFILCVNGGIAYSLYQQWQFVGVVDGGFLQVLIWPKLFILFFVVLFDWFFVNTAIRKMNKDKQFFKEEDRIESKQLSVVFFSIVILLGTVLFFGGPIKKGFYRGYYKVSGQKSKVGTKVTTLEVKKQEPVSLGLLDAQGKGKPSGEIFSRYQESSMILKDDSGSSGIKRKIKGIKSEIGSAGVSIINIIGFSFCVCLGLGFVFQIFQFEAFKEMKVRGVYSYLFFLISVCFLTMYGLSLKLPPLWLGGLMCIIINIIILILLLKRD